MISLQIYFLGFKCFLINCCFSHSNNGVGKVDGRVMMTDSVGFFFWRFLLEAVSSWARAWQRSDSKQNSTASASTLPWRALLGSLAPPAAAEAPLPPPQSTPAAILPHPLVSMNGGPKGLPRIQGQMHWTEPSPTSSTTPRVLAVFVFFYNRVTLSCDLHVKKELILYKISL